MLCSYAPRLWSRWALLALAASAVATAAGLLVTGRLPGATAQFETSNTWLMLTQFSVMSGVGLSIIALAVRDLQKRPGADSALLTVWVLGTFYFAALVNWTVNARSLLPMAPAVAILIMREISARSCKSRWPAIATPLVLTGILSLSVAWADYTTAAAARSAAYRVSSDHRLSDNKLWFAGHWGFQYYMQRLGAKPIDDNRSEIPENSTIVVPILNTQLVPIPEDSYVLEEEISLPVMGWLGSMCEATGAAFYSSEFGSLPYVIGPQPPHTYCVITTTRVSISTWPIGVSARDY